LKALLKKFALMFPDVQRLKKDLDNRRMRAEEFEAANKVLVERNTELLDNLEFMKKQMSKAISLKDTAIYAESSLAAKAEHYHGQLSITGEKLRVKTQEFEKLEVENMLLRLTNEGIIKSNKARKSGSQRKSA